MAWHVLCTSLAYQISTEAKTMKVNRQAMMVVLLLTAIGGCRAARQSGGAKVQWADGGGTKGEYKPWMDVNNQPLPRTWWWPLGSGYPWQSGSFYSDTSTPPLR